MESFEQEGRCYLWLIPKLQAMRAEKNLKPLAFPKCFYVSAENSILILENMKAQDYDVVEKKLEREFFTLLLSPKCFFIEFKREF